MSQTRAHPTARNRDPCKKNAQKCTTRSLRSIPKQSRFRAKPDPFGATNRQRSNDPQPDSFQQNTHHALSTESPGAPIEPIHISANRSHLWSAHSCAPRRDSSRRVCPGNDPSAWHRQTKPTRTEPKRITKRMALNKISNLGKNQKHFQPQRQKIEATETIPRTTIPYAKINSPTLVIKPRIPCLYS